MSELEERFSSILQNPQIMQQIMGMAKALSGPAQPEPEKQSEPEKKPEAPEPQLSIDPRLLNSLMGIAKQGGMDQNQLGLLKALQPYLSRDRITKLERAMGAARMAVAASAFLNSGGLQKLTGR